MAHSYIVQGLVILLLATGAIIENNESRPLPPKENILVPEQRPRRTGWN